MTMAMPKQKLKNRAISYIARLPLLILVFVFILASSGTQLVLADRFDEKINQLNQETSLKQAKNQQLGSEASSLSVKINKLQVEINALRDQINEYISDIKKLRGQIKEQEEELEHQKAILGQNIKAMYLEGQITTLEMLASSRDLSEYVDKEQYRFAVQGKITVTMDKIIELKHQLKAKADQIKSKLDDKRVVEDRLASQQAENNDLLGLNENQQAILNNAIQNNNAQVARLRAQQAIENARFIGPAGDGPACGGGYPAKWCEVPQDSVIDNWGMYNRECVSYTAFRVAASGRHMPYWGGQGNANEWDDNARNGWRLSKPIPVDGNPRAGDVAISNSGFYGHAMYVESVNSNGTINISQYNASLNGRYSTNTISKSGLVFIHFP